MKILILTSKPYWKFVNEIANQYSEHEFWISEATTFPKKYDVGISFMHLSKVPAEQVNTHPWFNFHPASLPEYKGRNLCYHAIMNGEEMFGATIHYMDENFDTGDIIDVFRFVIEPHWTAEDLYNRAIDLSKRLFREFLPRILEGEEFPRTPNVGGVYYKKDSIVDTMDMTGVFFGDFVRAVTYKQFYPKITVGDTVYKIVRDK